MSIEGRFAVDVSFIDTTTGSPSSVKKITLAGATTHSTGKVAMLTGTVGTSATSIDVAAPVYRDSSGSRVKFSTVSKIAFSAVDTATATVTGCVLRSSGSRVAVSDCSTTGTVSIAKLGTSGTTTYSVVLYGT